MSVAFAINLLDGSGGTRPEWSRQGRTFADGQDFDFGEKWETKNEKHPIGHDSAGQANPGIAGNIASYVDSSMSKKRNL